MFEEVISHDELAKAVTTTLDYLWEDEERAYFEQHERMGDMRDADVWDEWLIEPQFNSEDEREGIFPALLVLRRWLTLDYAPTAGLS